MIQPLETPIQDRCITLYGVSWDRFDAIASLLEHRFSNQGTKEKSVQGEVPERG